MSIAHEYYARFAAEERMAELRGEAQAWRLARVAAGHRCPPAHRLRLVTTRVAAASSQAVRRLTAGGLMPSPPEPSRPGLRRSASGRPEPQPCGC